MIRVKVIAKNIYPLLDEGSTITILNKQVADYVGAEFIHTNVSLRGLGQIAPLAISNKKVNIHLQTNDFKCDLNNILLIDNLALPSQRLTSAISELCEKETGVKVSSFVATADLLIGQDYVNLIICRELREFFSNSLLVSRCLLGWSIHGPMNENKTKKQLVLHSDCDSNSNDWSYETLNNLIKEYFNLDALGVCKLKYENNENKRALQILNDTSVYNKDHWEVGLLWKNDSLSFPNSRQNAANRLKLLERKLDHDLDYASLYYKEMDRLFENGYAEKAPKVSNERLWYLSHFGLLM